jgi:hypothetical protein
MFFGWDRVRRYLWIPRKRFVLIIQVDAERFVRATVFFKGRSIVMVFIVTAAVFFLVEKLNACQLATAIVHVHVHAYGEQGVHGAEHYGNRFSHFSCANVGL